eukprot:10957968-Karenia_brevis.AAC.1
MKIMNTMFRKRWEHAWTHTQDGRMRIIDYILADMKAYKHISDIRACDCIDLGSDHRALVATWNIRTSKLRRQERHKNKAKKLTGWQPVDDASYASQ